MSTVDYVALVVLIPALIAGFVLIMRGVMQRPPFRPLISLADRYGLTPSGTGGLKGSHAGIAIHVSQGGSLRGHSSLEWTLLTLTGGLPADLAFTARRFLQRPFTTVVPSGDASFDRAVVCQGRVEVLRALTPEARVVLKRVAREGWRLRGGKLGFEAMGHAPYGLDAALELGLEAAALLRQP